MAIIRFIPGGQLRNVDRVEALRLIKSGVAEMAGAMEPEAAIIEAAETAMVSTAPVPRKRGRPRKVRD